MQSLEKLNRFRTGCSAHIENEMMRLDIEEERRKHRDRFLSREVSCFGFVDKEMLEFTEGFILSDVLFRDVELPSISIRIPMKLICKQMALLMIELYIHTKLGVSER